jgi:8-oxo-dGTP pyrophosphatase MutT (NUDIX family)
VLHPPKAPRHGPTAGAHATPLTLHRVAEALQAGPSPWINPQPVRWRAAVACVLRERHNDLELLVIRRAERPGDRWSGHAALPGGRVDPGDRSDEDTAVRETHEEVGLDLRALGARVLGRLSDHPPASQRRWANFSVTPMVFGLDGDPPLRLDPREVAEARWVPLSSLRPAQGRMLWWWRPLRRLPVVLPMVLPRWRLEALTIWGMTYGMVDELLQRVDR